MSFDGPVIQSPNQERRRINRPSVVIVLALTALFVAAVIWAVLTY